MYILDTDHFSLVEWGSGAIGPNALDEVRALADIGTSRVVVPAFLFYRDTTDALARYGDEVISTAT